MKFVVRTPEDAAEAAKAIYAAQMPCRVTIREGEDRSAQQNNTAWMWAEDIVLQRPDMETRQKVHSFNKLHFGVAIRKEDEDFRDKYDRIIRPLSYEAKLELMAPPIDLPVTRDMGVRQMNQFLGDVWNHWTAEGLRLRDPDRRAA